MNAIKVLNARFANREREFVQSPYWDQREPEHHTPRLCINGTEWYYPKTEYCTAGEWGQKDTRDAQYDAMWARHLEWCDRVWPAPAGTGWEVTPPTGKVVS